MTATLKKSRFRLLAALALAAFLGAQAGMLVHLHADDSIAADCLQCQLDGKPAIPLAGGDFPALPPVLGYHLASVVAVPVAFPYRRRARGPPTTSS